MLAELESVIFELVRKTSNILISIVLGLVLLGGCTLCQLKDLPDPIKVPVLVETEEPKEDFFPLGWYSSLEPEELKEIADLGGNFVITYVLSGREDHKIKPFLDEAEKLGIQVLLDVTADWMWLDDDMPQPSHSIGDWRWSFEYAYSKRASHHGAFRKNAQNDHGFRFAEGGYPVMNIQPHDIIENWIYIPSDSNISELMIEFWAAKLTGGFSWKYRVYWGEDKCQRYFDGEKLPKVRAGDIPKERDQWVKLAFDVDLIGLDQTVVHGINFVNYGSQVYWDKLTRRTGKKRLEERVAEFWDHPALYGWYLCDEPEMRNITPERMKEIYDIVRAADPDPNNILAPVYQDWKVVEPFSNSSDEIFIDCYPVETDRQVLDWMTKWVSEAQRVATKQGKKFYFIPQAFGDISAYPYWTKPNEHQFRWMTWTPIIMGARGICYWAYYVAPDYLIKQSKELFAEIRSYMDYFQFGNVVTGLSCNITEDSDGDGNPNLLYSAIDYDGKRLLMISNGISKNQKVKITGSEFKFESEIGPHEIIIKELEL
ncbi:MAG: hypothetical protein R2883_02835 [Caldisericia bacterium]